MSLKTTFDSCNRGSGADKVLNKEDLSRDWFSERAGGWEGLKCGSGSKTVMRLGGLYSILEMEVGFKHLHS